MKYADAVRAALAFVSLFGGCNLAIGLRDDYFLRDGSAPDAPDADRDAGVLDADASSGCDVVCDGLIAFYPFDEGAGSTFHDVIHGYDGAVVAPDNQTWTTGHRGAALNVHNGTSCARVNNMPMALWLNKTPFTIAAWINVRTWPGSGMSAYVASKTLDVSIKGWAFAARSSSTGQSELELAIGQTPQPPLQWFAPVASSGWLHVAVTVNQTNIVFYAGGTKAKDNALTGLTLFNDAAADLRIGCRSDEVRAFEGAIDEVRIYGRVLTPMEITTLATQ